MKKIFVFGVVLLFNCPVIAQIPAIYADNFPDHANARVGITADYDLNSNALTNSLITKFYTGGYIDDGMKKTVLNELKNKNRIGGNYSYGIYAAIKPDSIFHKKYLSFFISVRDRFHFDAQFSRDLYKLGFYGNAQFAGETANLNGFNLNLLHYQQVQVGMVSSNLDSVARWGVAASFLKGQDYLTIQSPIAELYTSTDGQYIDFNTQTTMVRSDTGKGGYTAFNGYGASVDLFFEAPLQTSIGPSKIKVSVSDIGMIRYNQQSLWLKQDSTLHYSGIYLNGLTNIESSNGENVRDSLINTIAPIKKASYSVTLPAVLDVTYSTEISKRFHLVEGFRYVFNANYGLLAYVRGKFLINQSFMASATIGYGGYGGYGRLNYGLGIYANLTNGFVLYAGSNNVEGYFAPKHNAGQGVYLSLIKNFK